MKIEQGQKGFTLVELLIVIMIIGILAAVGYPMYTAQVRETNRSSMQGQMQALSTALETYKSQNFSYGGAQLANLATNKLQNDTGYDVTFVDSGGNEVTTLPAGAQSYDIRAEPVAGSIMEDTGALKMNNQGQTCWDPADDTDCTYGTDKSWSE